MVKPEGGRERRDGSGRKGELIIDEGGERERWREGVDQTTRNHGPAEQN